MPRTAIAPVVAVLVLAAEAIFQVDVPDTLEADMVTWAVLGVSVGVSIWGIVKNHKKK